MPYPTAAYIRSELIIAAIVPPNWSIEQIVWVFKARSSLECLTRKTHDICGAETGRTQKLRAIPSLSGQETERLLTVIHISCYLYDVAF
jgi:hypothetical protein